jgi:putative transposase
MRPSRERMRKGKSVYFVSAQTTDRMPFFRHERWARLMIAMLEHDGQRDFRLHAFVIMPDHLLITPAETVERSVQLIKGGFSFRAKREFDWRGEIWQPGFTEHRVRDDQDWKHHVDYIRMNPVRSGLVEDSALYPYMNFMTRGFPQGLKPASAGSGDDVRAEARTLPKAHTLREARTVQTEVAPFQNTTFAEQI